MTIPMRPDSLGQAFGRLCANEGVEGVSLHTLRHFSASVLVASGRDVRTIAGRLGHADASTTLRVYSHMVEGRDRDAADFLGSLLSPDKTRALNEGRPVDAVEPSDREAARNPA
jgi:integrase